MRNTTFRGIQPRAMADTLSNNYGSYVANCLLHDGAIRPIRAPSYDAKSVSVEGIQNSHDTARLSMVGDIFMGTPKGTFVAPDLSGQGGTNGIIFNFEGRLYRTHEDMLQTNVAPAEVGICPPTQAPELEVQEGETCAPTYDIKLEGCLDEQLTMTCQDDKAVVSFLVTYVNACGDESAPSPPSEPLMFEMTEKLSVIATDTPPPNAVARRWYVAVTTGETTDWYLVDETPIEQVLLSYCHSMFSFNDILITEEHNAPPTCIDGVAVVGDGTTVVWHERNLWFSEPQLPHAYPDRHRQTIEDNIVGIYTVTEQSSGNGMAYHAVVLTDGHPYILRGDLPENMTLTRLDRSAPCINKHGVLCIDASVFYASDDGLYRVTGSSVYSITNAWFTREEWQTLDPAQFSIGYFNDRLFAFHAQRDGLMMKYPKENSQYQEDMVYVTPRYDAVHTSRTGKMYCLNQSGDVFLWEASSRRLQATWRSKDFTQSGLWKPTSAKVIADAHEFALGEAQQAYAHMVIQQQEQAPHYCPEQYVMRYPEQMKYLSYLHAQVIVFSVYADKKLMYRRTVRSQKPFRLKRDRKRIYWAYEVITQVPIREIHVQTSLDDLSQEGGHA